MGGRSGLLVLALCLLDLVVNNGNRSSGIGGAGWATRSGRTSRFLGRSTLPTPPGPLPGQGRATEVVADLSADRFRLHLLGQNGKVSLIGYESTSFRENPAKLYFALF